MVSWEKAVKFSSNMVEVIDIIIVISIIYFEVMLGLVLSQILKHPFHFQIPPIRIMTTISPLEHNYTSTIMVYIQSNIQKSVIISLRIQPS